MQSLEKLTSLKDLILENTDITDAGLARLKSLSALRLLNLAAAPT